MAVKQKQRAWWEWKRWSWTGRIRVKGWPLVPVSFGIPWASWMHPWTFFDSEKRGRAIDHRMGCVVLPNEEDEMFRSMCLGMSFFCVRLWVVPPVCFSANTRSMLCTNAVLCVRPLSKRRTCKARWVGAVARGEACVLHLTLSIHRR